ncbi:hypothetical protein THAOC_30521, partial [Thalassiosira oceanica]
QWSEGKQNGRGWHVFIQGDDSFKMFERDYVNDELILGKVSFQPHRDPRLEYYGGLDDWLEESGQGTMKFKNGDIYEGGFERSVMHGVGKFTFSDADILGRLHFQGCWDKAPRKLINLGPYQPWLLRATKPDETVELSNSFADSRASRFAGFRGRENPREVARGARTREARESAKALRPDSGFFQVSSYQDGSGKGEAGTLPPGDTTGLVSTISPADERRQRYLLDLMWASLDGDYEFSDFELSLLWTPKSDTTVPSSMAEPTPVAESAPAASSSVVDQMPVTESATAAPSSLAEPTPSHTTPVVWPEDVATTPVEGPARELEGGNNRPPPEEAYLGSSDRDGTAPRLIDR